jgi:iron complex transport system permease protein
MASPKPLTAGRLAAVLLGLTLLVVLVWAGCTLVGRYQLTEQVWRFRAVRVFAAGLIGLALASGGLALQGLVRNPLAEPYILGISSGAGVGVLLGRALAVDELLPRWLTEPGLAMVGGLVTCFVVWGIAQRRGRLDPFVLLLAGVIVNVFNGALILVLFLFASPEDIASFIGWGMGQVPDWLITQPGLAWSATACILAGWGALMLRGSAFNALGMGDEVAGSMGVPVQRLRVETFVVVSLMTAAAVAIAGPVGFVGLIVPHACRLIFGPDHRVLLVVAGLLGAAFVMLADTACRTVGEWVGLAEIPVGVLTALAGGPFFIVLLRRRFRGMS